MPNGNGDKGRLLINAALAAVVLLIVVALITSIYATMQAGAADSASFWRDPQIIAVAIGLILSVLFIDRWRSLESKVDNLSRDQSQKLKDIQSFAKEHTELQVGQAISKADKVSAKLASIAERHPWLEVITDRDMIVETESVRGILRTSYSLLQLGKNLHLFEFLEYCSRKGTASDPREVKLPLRGTVEDFLEIATFCEVWLGDYALSAEFLKRYIDSAGHAAYVLYPDYIRRLLRVGNLPAARDQIRLLSSILARQRLHARLPIFQVVYPVSERYRWNAANALALAYSAIGNLRLAQRMVQSARTSPYAKLLPAEQSLTDSELLIGAGDFRAAEAVLSKLDMEKATVFELRDQIVLLEKLGAYELADRARFQIEAKRALAFGDIWPGDNGFESKPGSMTAPSREAGGSIPNAPADTAIRDQQRTRGASPSVDQGGPGSRPEKSDTEPDLKV